MTLLTRLALIVLLALAVGLLGLAALGGSAGAEDYEVSPYDAAAPGGKTTFPGFRGPGYHVATEERDPLRPDSHHRHMFYCSMNRSHTPTAAELLASPTNCERPSDHSMYWMPEIRVNGAVVERRFTGAYWQTFGGAVDPRLTRPIPDDFRMIASDALGDVSFACTVRQNAGNVTPNLPDCEAGQGLGLRITFAPCWDTQPPGEDGIHSVAEMVKKANGDRECPASHPRQLPTQTLWPDFPAPAFTNGPDVVEVSSGRGEWSPPSAMHADSITAFAGGPGENNSMEELVADCINPYTDREERPGRCDGNVYFD